MTDSTEPTGAETHISWVLLGDEHAFKVLKPVVTDVVDQRTVESRRALCTREVEVNSRLAPDVYLGVGSIDLLGESLEPVIVMRRMPAARRLAALLDSPEIGDRIVEVARSIATFHASAEVLDAAAARRVASADGLASRWRADVAGLRDAGGPSVSERADRIEQLAIEYLSGRDRLLDERIERGMVRDGHGDLLADDIFCLDDGPRILDALAFDDELRHGDVLADVAFLVMDLQRLGHPDLARRFLRSYAEFGDEHHPGTLAHLYVAQRALVRAKILALRHRPTGHHRPRIDAGDHEVDRLLCLVLDHLERTRVHVALVGGLPGSGKSTVAGRLGDELGWTVLSSDEIRRDLGLRYQDLRSESAYDSQTVATVYEELRHRANEALRRGISVILDATWTSAHERAMTRAMAAAAHAEVLEFRCDAAPALCRRRVDQRARPSHSEATPAVVDVLAERADPWPESVAVGTADVGSEEVWSALAVTSSAVWWADSSAGSPSSPARPGATDTMGP